MWLGVDGHTCASSWQAFLRSHLAALSSLLVTRCWPSRHENSPQKWWHSSLLFQQLAFKWRFSVTKVCLDWQARLRAFSDSLSCVQSCLTSEHLTDSSVWTHSRSKPWEAWESRSSVSRLWESLEGLEELLGYLQNQWSWSEVDCWNEPGYLFWGWMWSLNWRHILHSSSSSSSQFSSLRALW